VRSYEEICGAFDSKGGRRPQSPVSTTVNGNCSTSHRRRRRGAWVCRRRSKRWSTARHLDDSWRSSLIRVAILQIFSFSQMMH